MIIPSIDLMGGRAVQLRQGREKALEVDDVAGLAEEFRKYGEIAVIDLDAAMGKGDNTALVKRLCAIADCRVGGGLRNRDKAIEMLKAGAKKIIVGTMATPQFLQTLPRDKVIVAVDTKNGEVVSEGWAKATGKNPLEQMRELEPYCSEFLFTNVDREGLLAGVETQLLGRLRQATKNKITFAGGIASIEEIKMLEQEGFNSQIGMALYTGKIRLADAFVSLLDFGKNNALVPTIVQDEKGQVLMMAFSSKGSLSKTFECGRANYYSRSRKKLWQKGETSGSFQQIIKARYDCDRDTLLFTVKQNGKACHMGQYSCFGEKESGFGGLYGNLVERIGNPRPGSYTAKLSSDEKLLKSKIKEEAMEVARYKDRENLVWEIADLAYFVMVLMARNGVTIDEVKNELEGRRKA